MRECEHRTYRYGEEHERIQVEMKLKTETWESLKSAANIAKSGDLFRWDGDEGDNSSRGPSQADENFRLFFSGCVTWRHRAWDPPISDDLKILGPGVYKDQSSRTFQKFPNPPKICITSASYLLD